MQIINVMAVSADGKIGAHHLESDESRLTYGLTSKADQEHVASMLHHADAVITGGNSLRAAQTAWEEVNHQGVCPTWAVMTRNGVEDDLPFWKQENVPKLVVSPHPVPIPKHACRAEALVVDEAHQVSMLVDALKKRGAERVLLFGGSQINFLFYQAKMVHQLVLTLCPVLLTTPNAIPLIGQELPDPISLVLESSHSVGSHVFLKYTVKY